MNTKEMAIFKIILKLLILSFLHNNLQNKIGITVSWKERSREAGGRKDVREGKSHAGKMFGEAGEEVRGIKKEW